MRRLPHLRWLVLTGLFLLPAAVYWKTIFFRYGLRDDYSVLRETHEEPGKVFRFCSSQARPIYGWILQTSFGRVDGIDGLHWLRLLDAGLLGVFAIAFFRLLRRAKWDRITAALVAALVTLLPSAQVWVSWTVAWPLPIALLLAMAAFVCAERAFSPDTQWRGASWAAAILLMAASALVYQPNSLFYFAPVAASLWPRRRWVPRSCCEWMIRHGVTAGLGLCLAFTVMMVAFARGWTPVSQRVAIEDDWLGKLDWFVSAPLHNALALFALADDYGSRVAHRAALLVAVLLLAGVARECETRGWRHGAWWLVALCGLLFASFSVNLIADDQWPAYRVLFPLATVVLVFTTLALQTLGGRRLARWVLLILLPPAAWLARRQTFELIAWPQSLELALIERAAAKVDPARQPRVYVITPTKFDRVTERIFCDEFGSLSTDSDWTPKEMLKLAVQERHPGIARPSDAFSFSCGRIPPRERGYDVVIDLRKLRDFRKR